MKGKNENPRPAMVDRPIIFSAPMILALLAGTKTQTRRLAWRKRQSAFWKTEHGDRLWVKESLSARPMANFLTGGPTNAIVAAYAADDEDVCDEAGFNLVPWWKDGEKNRRGLAAMHMPRLRSRITLTVTDVRVQRLQKISDEDAHAEGVPPFVWVDRTIDAPHRYNFQLLWDELHGPGAWAANPEVVALSFSVQQRNIDHG